MKRKYMEEAIHLARWGMENDKGGPFGAVVVKDGVVVGWGYNTVTSSNDPTAHAEINAIRDACRNLDTFSLEGCVIYTSCEPCPMCLSAIYWARIERIFFACEMGDAAEAGFIDEDIYKEFCLPHSLRKIPSEQLMRRESIEVFQRWRAKEDRLLY